MPLSATPFLMFTGDAEAATALYTSVFAHATVTKTGEGPATRRELVIAGQKFMCVDSPAVHAFGFTPALSIFVTCESEEEVRAASEKLSAGGKVLMPVAAYPFAKLFAWVDDRFGVSWQLCFR